MYKVHCIDCKKEYEDNEPDDYRCPECLVVHKQRAAEIDKKLSKSPRKKIISDLQAFDMLAKEKGTRGFVNIKDLI
uniref:Uncharacterized protein n=1 Tax=viral metagenome TaxID=1070528 RepID=A0A6M3XQM4_9ZZZZ